MEPEHQKEHPRPSTTVCTAVSFMYVHPPGYNPESAKAAEIEDEKRKLNQGPDKKRSRPKDVFGRSLPTEQEFEVLKNAPRYFLSLIFDDRECPMKDIIMPNEESRLKRDDPLTAIKAHTDTSEVKEEGESRPGQQLVR